VSPEPGASGRRQVVVVGGGFGGFAAARALRHADVNVTLVDRTNHHLFQPLLYQVAAGALSEGECAATIRGMLRRQGNATLLMASVTAIDAEAHTVTLDSGESLDYDSLILAGGAETSYFGHDEWAKDAPGLKTLADAVELRDRIFGAFEQAERATDEATRKEWLSFVVVGGGPTGVEISGQLAILARRTLERKFHRIDTADAQITLVDAGARLVPAFDEKLSAKTAEFLASLGVVVRDGAMVTAIDSGGVEVKVGEETERIQGRTVIWAAGVKAAGLAALAVEATGAGTDRGGRVEVGTDCAIPGHPEISVIGDMASHPGPEGKPLPGMATVALQQARHVARGIGAGNSGATAPFHYLDKGALAVVGRGKAVCEVRGRKLSGPLAFYMYLGIHLYYLSGVPGHRIAVLRSWFESLFRVRAEQVIEAELPVR
jgi:NADH:ubiquinone reductase (H+-translocating)